MRKRLVVVGDSPLSFFVARSLDRELARQSHLEAVYLGRDRQLVYFPGLTTLLGQPDFINRAAAFTHFKVLKTKIRSINLIDRRLIGERDIIDYDYLVLDQTPVFTSDELKAIAEQSAEVIRRLKAATKLGRHLTAAIRFLGDLPVAWQVALALQSDLRSLDSQVASRLHLQVEANDGRLGRFLRRQGLMSVATEALGAGFRVQAPSPSIISNRVKGLLLDQKAQAITTTALNLESHPEVFVIDGRCRYQNLLRPAKAVAAQIAHNVEAMVVGSRLTAVEMPKAFYLLVGWEGLFLQFNSTISELLRASAIHTLDHAAYRRLKAA